MKICVSVVARFFRRIANRIKLRSRREFVGQNISWACCMPCPDCNSWNTISFKIYRSDRKWSNIHDLYIVCKKCRAIHDSARGSVKFPDGPWHRTLDVESNIGYKGALRYLAKARYRNRKQRSELHQVNVPEVPQRVI